jgi:hypothetical protein
MYKFLYHSLVATMIPSCQYSHHRYSLPSIVWGLLIAGVTVTMTAAALVGYGRFVSSPMKKLESQRSGERDDAVGGTTAIVATAKLHHRIREGGTTSWRLPRLSRFQDVVVAIDRLSMVWFETTPPPL